MADTSLQPLPKLSRKRVFIDSITKKTVSAGGIAVICAIVLIMGYLAWVVVPILIPASIQYLETHTLDDKGVLQIASDDTFETLALVHADGVVRFRETEDFSIIEESRVSDEPIVSSQLVYPTTDTYSTVTETGNLLFFRISHSVRFNADERRIESSASVLFNGSPILMSNVVDFDVYREDSRLRIASLSNDGSIKIEEYRGIDDSFDLEAPRTLDIAPWVHPSERSRIMLGPRGRWLYQFDSLSGAYRLLNISSIRRAAVEAQGTFQTTDDNVLSISPVLGRYSLLISLDSGELEHWTLGPVEDRTDFTKIRTFQYDNPITKVIREHRRKGFLAISTAGTAHLGYTTSNLKLANIDLGFIPEIAEFSPRADRVITLHNREIRTFAVSNKHPEVSWSTLWNTVWYEGYEKPVHSWQSSSADTDFEPKFSLTPLLFGTIKAAFYAMLVATPLAVMGAIYTAVFMSPGMRKLIKPGIEIMAALPTVILGFLAGLWLAPIVEENLTSIF